MKTDLMITKDIFEQYVPVAKTPERNDSVFARMTKLFPQHYGQLVNSTVSPGMADRAEKSENVLALIIQHVCIETFAENMRSFDLVLTATGFGIVSTQSTAPASQVRVEKLLSQLRIQRMQVHEQLVTELIRMEGWGQTMQAHQCISNLFWQLSNIRNHTSLTLSPENVQAARGKAVTADTHLRNTISTEYMDELLTKWRCNQLNTADCIIVEKCIRFIGDFVSQDQPVPNRMMLDALIQQLEKFADNYPTYKESMLYRSRHAERYKNKREDPTFFFM